MATTFRNLCALFFAVGGLILAGPGSACAETGQVALTFDDLPGLSLVPDQPYVNYLNVMLLRGLKRHRFSATGFVNEDKLDNLDRAQQIANLQKWIDAGLDLGNHTFSHDSPNELGAKGYIADIVRGEPVTRGLLQVKGRSLRWFRHPYLETGTPAAVKEEIETWLSGHGYRIAPVTIDADDWEFAAPYDDALSRHDEAQRLRIRSQYLEHTERTIAWSQTASRGLFDRPIPLVLLLHATRLNADVMDDLAAILKRRHLRVVTLDAAMRDPAYRTRDPYVGKDGIDWLERWSNELHKSLPWATWRDPPKDIEAQYDRLQSDRHEPATVSPRTGP
jgi:peptidoglycan/xylan/chitin deacetylase (PgdA/CDA1 family)